MVRAHKAPQRPIDIEGDCPYDSGDVQKYSTKCVWPVMGEYKTWHDADIDCGRKASHLGGHIKGYLMSIHSVHDIEFVQNMISSSIWIGLTTNRADGWMWSDGTAVQVCTSLVRLLVRRTRTKQNYSLRNGQRANHQVMKRIVLKCIKMDFGTMRNVP